MLIERVTSVGGCRTGESIIWLWQSLLCALEHTDDK